MAADQRVSHVTAMTHEKLRLGYNLKTGAVFDNVYIERLKFPIIL
jgi:hypothetical protein